MFCVAACTDDGRDSAGDGDGDVGNDDDDDDGIIVSADDDDGADDDDDDGVDDDDDVGKPFFLVIDPPELVRELDLGAPLAVRFSIVAMYADDVQRDVTGEATWTTSNASLGAMEDETATFSTPGFAQNTVGSTVLTASLDGAKGEAQLTVAAYKQSGVNPDFFFILPFEGTPHAKELTFGTDVKSMDVFVNMDTTGSMGPPIANLQAALTTDIIPHAQSKIPDTQFGVGHFEDYPLGSYGAVDASETGTDQPFFLSQAISASSDAVADAVGAYTEDGDPVGSGFDFPESMIESLYQIATGSGLDGPDDTFVPANHDGIGGVGFRPGTMPVVVTISDAVSHAPGEADCEFNGTSVDISYDDPTISEAATRDEAKDALADICARVVGIAVNSEPSCSALSDITDFAVATGARVPPQIWDEEGSRPAGCNVEACCTGVNGQGVAADADGLCPLVYRVDEDGEGVDAGVVEGLAMLTRYAPFDVMRTVTGDATGTMGESLPVGKTTLDFIRAVLPHSYGVPPLESAPEPSMSDNAFLNVTPGTAVTFEISAQNDFLFVPAGAAAQVFVAHIQVSAGQCADLDDRDVYILVPPATLPPPG
ncbi:MAG: hypothetical protein V3V08_19805 [Nannocystaceae bacterium]